MNNHDSFLIMAVSNSAYATIDLTLSSTIIITSKKLDMTNCDDSNLFMGKKLTSRHHFHQKKIWICLN